MPSPVRPSQICAAVPTTSADFCAKIKLVLVQLPNYLCSIFSWMLNEDGSLTTEFKDAASPFPAGFIMASGNASAPMGWLLCNGQAVSRTTYAVLFAEWGTKYGAGDGSTTFNVPDLRDRTLIGASTTHPLGWTGGAETHTLVLAEMPAHQHQVAGRPLDPAIASNQATNEVIIDDDWLGGSISKTTDTRGSDQPHNNMQPSFAVNYFVKY